MHCVDPLWQYFWGSLVLSEVGALVWEGNPVGPHASAPTKLPLQSDGSGFRR